MSTTSSMTFLQSAQSPDRSLVAVVPPSSAPASSSNAARLSVQIYQVTSSSCQLQLTLTHTSSSPSARLQELVFCGDSVIVARFGTVQIVRWDLDRGVVSQILEAQGDEEFMGLAASTTNGCFYNLTKHGSNKLVVQEYASSTGKLVRKIKSGRWEGGESDSSSSMTSMSTLCVSSSHVVVQTAPGSLRVMNCQTGKKFGRIKAGGKGGGGSGAIVFTAMKLVKGSGTDDTLVAMQSGGTIFFYNASNCEEISKPLVHHSMCSATGLLSDGLLQPTNDLSLVLVENTILASNKGSSSLSSLLSFETLTTLHSTHPIAPFLTKDDGRVMTLVHQTRSGCQAQWVDLKEGIVPERLDLDQVASDHGVAAALDAKGGASAEKPTKRKSTEPMILGPGQAGIEVVAQPTKKSKLEGEDLDQDDNEDEEEPSAKDITIAERLQQLTNALDDDDDDDDDDDNEEEEKDAVSKDGDSTMKSSFKPHRATTESLKELLSQALQSGDDSLLELALAVRDVKVIATTLKDIGSSRIVTLLSKLTTRLATNPLRAEGLALWLSHCLKQGRFQPHHLAPLRNLLYERTESFSDLLRLEGRLALMCDME